MASQGPNSPGTAAKVARAGSGAGHDVIDTGNVFASDNSYASIWMSGPNTDYSPWLQVTNFGFSIPAGATIDGIAVEVERSTPNSVRDHAARIVKGGTIGSTDRANADAWTSTDTYVAYGGITDLWGETWSASDVNASDFGFALSCQEFGFGDHQGKVDHVRITVYYTEAAASRAPPPKRRQTKFFRRAG